ncbi:galactose mutarotase [Olivibacter ginsenosidimutans]|uniref:Aldose 1-epimerase n=1 Tax=Olivibacter ginsenosidimutans TaxID=1176537 RepID=A0ABP9BV09_9SPHI
MNTQKIHISLLFVSLGILFACSPSPNKERTQSGLLRKDFQTIVHGDSTDLFILRNTQGMEACITNYGARLVSLIVPDKNGKATDVVLGFNRIADYLAQPSSFGATMGRVTNRIGYGKFVLDNDTIMIDKNNGEHAIHGGSAGWRGQVFAADQPNDSTLQLSYQSPDGESGFPGNVQAQVTYTLTHDGALAIHYHATTDKKTVINLTNHSFFNLSGNPEQSALNDILYVNGDTYTPLDSNLIPTGEIASVAHTPFDFRQPLVIQTGMDRDPKHQQLQFVGGLDHNWVLNTKGDTSILAASLREPNNGITLSVYTNEPGIQVYTSNSLDGSQLGKGGKALKQFSAVCLETQHYPDAPNKPDWPSTILAPGSTYQSTCIYRFTIE